MHQREDLGEVDKEREESGMTGELRVKCLRDNAVLPIRRTAGVARYDINVASGCVILAHGKGSVDKGLDVVHCVRVSLTGTTVAAIMQCGTAKNGKISRRNFSPRETDCPVHFAHTN